jgi:hypothetical protein
MLIDGERCKRNAAAALRGTTNPRHNQVVHSLEKKVVHSLRDKVGHSLREWPKRLARNQKLLFSRLKKARAL